MRRDAARSQTIRRRLGSVTLARSRVRLWAEYEFVSCRHHRIQRTGSLRITGFDPNVADIKWKKRALFASLLLDETVKILLATVAPNCEGE